VTPDARGQLSRREALAGGLAWPLGAGAEPATYRAEAQPRWRSQFRAGLADWGRLRDDWGAENHRFLHEDGVAGQLLRVLMREGSIDPGTMARRGLPRSGTGFKAAVIAAAPGGATDSATLRYRVRFSPGFDFVRGGKLPGLYGGRGHSGGVQPTGEDGFSMRLMWRESGQGEVYAYLPGSGARHGVSLLRGRWHFVPGRWHQVTQQILLNTPGQADGLLRMWLDGVAVGEASGLRFRDHPAVRIDGVFVDLFFGGNDDSWAARADTHVDLAEFTVVAPAPALPHPAR
jgi:hypothetical protein